MSRILYSLYFIYAFYQTFTSSAISNLLNSELKLSPARVSTYYATVFIPFAFKPIYAFIAEAFPILKRNKRSYAIIFSILTSASVITQSFVKTYTMALITGILSSIGLASVGILFDGVSVRLSKQVNNAGKIQSSVYGIRYLGTFTASFIGVFISHFKLLSARTNLFIGGFLPLIAGLLTVFLYEIEIDRIPILKLLKQLLFLCFFPASYLKSLYYNQVVGYLNKNRLRIKEEKVKINIFDENEPSKIKKQDNEKYKIGEDNNGKNSPDSENDNDEKKDIELISKSDVPLLVEEEKDEEIEQIKAKEYLLYERYYPLWPLLLSLFVLMLVPNGTSVVSNFQYSKFKFNNWTNQIINHANSIAGLIGSFVFYKFLTRKDILKTMSVASILTSICLLSQVLVTNNIYAKIGISPAIIFILTQIFINLFNTLSFIPLMIIAANLCPVYMESTTFGIIFAVNNISSSISNFIQTALINAFHITKENYSNLHKLIIICAVFHSIPLICFYLIRNRLPSTFVAK